MKKNTYVLSNIDCAACALKIEDGVSKLVGVHDCSLNYMFLKLFVTFDELIVSDEEIETRIHDSLSGVRIEQKNNAEFIDTYEEPLVFRKKWFGFRRKNTRYMK